MVVIYTQIDGWLIWTHLCNWCLKLKVKGFFPFTVTGVKLVNLYSCFKQCLVILIRGALNFFSGRGVRPEFLKCGACELAFASEKGGLVSRKFPNLGACKQKISKCSCELKISKFGGLWTKIWAKIEAVEAKISKFSQKGSCELTLLLEMGPLRAAGEAWKGGLQGRTSPYPLSRSVPPRDINTTHEVKSNCRHIRMEA